MDQWTKIIIKLSMGNSGEGEKGFNGKTLVHWSKTIEVYGIIGESLDHEFWSRALLK